MVVAASDMAPASGAGVQTERTRGEQLVPISPSERGDRMTPPSRAPRSVEFTVIGKPEPGGSKRAFVVKGRPIITEDNKRSKPWRAMVVDAAAEVMSYTSEWGEGYYGFWPALEGPLSLTVVFYLPRPKGHYGKHGLRPSAPRFPSTRPDATKLLRPLEDALKGLVYRDDSQVVDLVAAKRYGDRPRAEIRVQCLAE